MVESFWIGRVIRQPCRPAAPADRAGRRARRWSALRRMTGWARLLGGFGDTRRRRTPADTRIPDGATRLLN
jgi:hypothetical protein